jgi:uncharacterized membrane protein YhaH (DUF805 family)
MGSMFNKQMLTSFDGRVNRAPFWIVSFVMAIVGMVVATVIAFVIGGELGGILAFAAYVVIYLWPALAVSIKRAHDRGRSGWFTLVGLVPILNIWWLVEIGFLRGTPGSNQYGPNPLGE